MMKKLLTMSMLLFASIAVFAQTPGPGPTPGSSDVGYINNDAGWDELSPDFCNQFPICFENTLDCEVEICYTITLTAKSGVYPLRICSKIKAGDTYCFEYEAFQALNTSGITIPASAVFLQDPDNPISVSHEISFNITYWDTRPKDQPLPLTFFESNLQCDPEGGLSTRTIIARVGTCPLVYRIFKGG